MPHVAFVDSSDSRISAALKSGKNSELGGGFKYTCYFHPYLGKWSQIDYFFFQMGWFNHHRKFLEPLGLFFVLICLIQMSTTEAPVCRSQSALAVFAGGCYVWYFSWKQPMFNVTLHIPGKYAHASLFSRAFFSYQSLRNSFSFLQKKL